MSSVGRVEVIVIDDGSPRPVGPLLDKLEKIPENLDIRLIRQENSGIGRTRNRGFREAKNDLVLFLDDDIILKPDSLKDIIESVEDEKCGVVFGSYPFISHESPSLERFAARFYGYDRLTKEKAFEYLDGIASGFLWVTKSKFGADKDLYRDDLKIPAAEEHELIYRFHNEGRRIAHARHISVTHNHHLELEWLAQQQYKYGQATSEAIRKYPGIIEMDRFAELRDSLEGSKGGLTKIVKNAASSRAGRRFVLILAKLAQRLAPNGENGRLYGLVTTAWFHSGYKDAERSPESIN
jgi:glycosyltransferase involved in cell wall biosynthesis